MKGYILLIYSNVCKDACEGCSGELTQPYLLPCKHHIGPCCRQRIFHDDPQVCPVEGCGERLFAEFENFKKRNTKERLELLKTAAQDTLTAILPVLDDFDRAKKAAEADDNIEPFSEGVMLVYNKLKTTLSQKGLTEMETTNEKFDVNIHHALTEIPAPTEEMKGKIIDTIEKGYKLNDKIIRYAKVVVGK